MNRANIYLDKEASYFTGERRDFVDRLSRDPDRVILEIGCGDGATGAYARGTERCGRYLGVELSAEAAAGAAALIDEVHVGDVEEMSLPFAAGSIDVLIASEVLEHLVDPWSLLRRLHPLMKKGGTVFASSPNIAHRSTLTMLLAGRWDLEDDGRMDRTHLRWFTPRTYADLFEQTGYDVVSLAPLRTPRRAARVFNLLTGHRLAHLFISQMVVEARVRAPS